MAGKFKEKTTDEYLNYSDWPSWLKQVSNGIILMIGIGTVSFVFWGSKIYQKLIDSEVAAVEFSQMRVLVMLFSSAAIIMTLSILFGEVLLVSISFIHTKILKLRDWVMIVHVNLIWLTVISVFRAVKIYHHYYLVSRSDEMIEEFFWCVLMAFLVALGGVALIGIAMKKGLFTKK